MPFCFKNVNFISPDKKFKLEKYIIFTSNLHLKILTKCSQIFVDGTFKICPVGFYQVLNIGGYYKDINSIIQIFLIPITGKSE